MGHTWRSAWGKAQAFIRNALDALADGLGKFDSTPIELPHKERL
jgi:hypothetical protein